MDAERGEPVVDAAAQLGANWIGSVRSRARPSNRGAHAALTVVPSRSAAYASKNRLAKWTSSRARNSPASNVLESTAASTSLVTCQYIRLKYATPSSCGRSASMAAIRSRTSSMDTARAHSTVAVLDGRAADRHPTR
jgi:hypothetical protein